MEEGMKLRGRLIQAGDKRYRIYHVERGVCFLAEADSTQLNLLQYDETVLYMQLEAGEIKTVDEEIPIAPISALKAEQKTRYDQRVAFIKDVEKAYGPTFTDLAGKKSKDEIKRIQEKYGIKSRDTIWRFIRIFIQSGCRYEAMLPKNEYGRTTNSHYNQKKKSGRPSKDELAQGKAIDEHDIKAMDFGVEYYRTHKYATKKNAWYAMRRKYYSIPSLTGESTLPPPNKYPTYRQFEYYLDKQLSKEEKGQIKVGKVEYQNAMRILTGSSQTHVDHPGQIVEVDATEADISLVSDDLLQTVGRPIVYFLVDVFSRAILACSASYENNSTLGFTNLMINLADDKEKYAARYGVESDKLASWPTGIIPEQIRVDRGSEYRCHNFREICERMNIEANLLPARMGSMKGIVEGKFHEFQTTWRPYVEKKGLITRDYGSKHHDEAVLKLEEFTQMMIAFILSYNEMHIYNYPLKKELLDAGITIFSPINIWKYGCRQYGEPRWITEADHDQYMFNLLEETAASIGKHGIKIDGLIYYADDPYVERLMTAGRGRNRHINVRRDPRDVSTIYYMNGGKLHIAKLNTQIPGQDAYEGMTLFEYERQYEAEKAAKRAGVRHNEDIEYARDAAYTAISSVRSETSPDKTSMRKSRAEEKNRVNHENRLETHLAGQVKPEPALPEPIKAEEPEDEYIEVDYDNLQDEIRKAIEKYHRDELL